MLAKNKPVGLEVPRWELPRMEREGGAKAKLSREDCVQPKACRSIAEEAFNPVGSQLRVAHCVLDVLVAQILLQRARVVALVDQLVAAGMAEHVEVDWEGQLGGDAQESEQLPHFRVAIGPPRSRRLIARGIPCRHGPRY